MESNKNKSKLEIKSFQIPNIRIKEKHSPTWLLQDERHNSSKQGTEGKGIEGMKETKNTNSIFTTQPRVSFCDSSVSVKKSLNTFVARLKELSSLRKIPSLFSAQCYETINDLAYFPRNVENKALDLSRKFLESFRIFALLKKVLKEFLRNPLYVIHPYQNFKIFWDLTQFSIMIFLFFYIPMDIVFDYANSKNVRLFFGILMLIDNILRFSTAYFYHGKLITDRKKIFKAYAPHFLLDLLTQISMIYDLLLNNNQTKIWTRLLKLVVFVQYRKFVHIYETLIDRFKIDMKFGYALDFLKLISTSIGIMHWVACTWYGIGFFSGEEKRWLDLQDIGNKTIFQKYIYSLYWTAVTMMTVGYGDLTPQNPTETIFVILIVIVGCGLFAYYIKYLILF